VFGGKGSKNRCSESTNATIFRVWEGDAPLDAHHTLNTVDVHYVGGRKTARHRDIVGHKVPKAALDVLSSTY
jgi:hypothetical protein